MGFDVRKYSSEREKAKKEKERMESDSTYRATMVASGRDKSVEKYSGGFDVRTYSLSRTFEDDFKGFNDRLNALNQSVNDYVSEYNSRFFDKEGNRREAYMPEVSEWLSAAEQKKASIASETDSLQSLLDKYDALLDSSSSKKIKEAFGSYMTAVNSAYEGYSGTSEFMSQFANDKEYADWKMPYEDTLAKAESASDNDERLYYMALANQKAVQEKAKILSETTMDGEGVSVLDAMNELAQIKDRGFKKEREKAVRDKMASLGMDFDEEYSWITGDSNVTAGGFFDWLGNAALSGLNSFNKGVTGTLDLILGKPLQSLGWENNPFSSTAEYYDNLYDNYTYDMNFQAEKMGGGKGFEYGGQLVQGVTGAVPDALVALMTAGASKAGSLATQAASSSGNLLTKAGITIQSMMKNPSFWTSFARTYSADYEEALNKGASEAVATFGATLSSLINSGIEIGIDGASGIQGLSQSVAEGNKSVLYDWVKSSLEEGGEEILQGFVNNAVSKLMYDSETELATLEQMVAEGAMGTAVGAILGGGQTLVTAPARKAANRYQQNMENIGESVDENTIAQLRDLAETMSGSRAYRMAQQIDTDSSKMFKGETLSEVIREVYGNQSTAAVEQLLVDSGIEASEASSLASELLKSSEGGQISRKLAKAIRKNPKLMSVWNNLTSSTESDVVLELQEAGLSATDAETLAMEMVGMVRDGAVSQNVAAAISSNPAVKEVYDSLVARNRYLGIRDQFVPNAENKTKAVAMLSGMGQSRQKSTVEETEETSIHGVKGVAEGSFEVSEDGKTRASGQEVTLKGIDHVETGKDGSKVAFVKTVDSEGNESVVSSKDVEYGSQDEALMYESFVQLDIDPAYFDSYVGGFVAEDFKTADGKIADDAVLQYTLGFNEAVNYGKVGIEVITEAEAGGKPVFEKSQFAHKLNRTARRNAFKAASEAAKKTADAKQEKIDAEVAKRKKSGKEKRKTAGKIHYDSSKINSSKKWAAVQLGKRLSALGLDVYFYESHLNARGAYVDDSGNEAPNGYYISKDGSIHIDLNAGSKGQGIMVYTMSHELTHFMADNNPREFKIFSELLVKWYGEKGQSVTDLIKTRMAGENLSWDDAYEEVIARSCEAFLTDSNITERLAELEQTDKKTFQTIRNWIRKFMNWVRSLYAKVNPESDEGMLLHMWKDEATEIHDAFFNTLAGAVENYQWIGARNLSDFADAKTVEGKEMFQHRAMEADKAAYRAMLLKHGQMSSSEIDSLFRTVDKALSIIKSNLEALDYAWDVDIDGRAFSPVKPNSDSLYKVSLDFSTLCRKRILQQAVQARLQEALNKQLSREESIAIRDELIKIQEEGRQIEIACALCYVESARMKSPAQIKKFMANRESVIKDFLASKSGGDIKQRIKQAEAEARERLGVGDTSLKGMSKKIADQIREAKKQAKKSYEPTAEEQKLIDVALDMSVSDFTSPQGLENLAKNYPVLFDAYTSYIRNATKSKGIENDTWWRAGDSDSIGDTLIANMNRENGLRSQSWSDFQVIHLLDYIAATIELSTRNAKQQAYSKVPDYIELMGNTGIMLNMSLIPAREFDGKLEYDAVEGIGYERSLELRDKYHATAGTICIGMGNAQIKLLLADGTIDYVIPYHKSGMAAHIRKLMHIPDWFDYEPYQSEENLSRRDAEKNAKKYGVKLLDESDPNYHKHTSFSEWFDLEVAQQIAKMENANPSNTDAQKKYGVMYGGYMAMQDAANNYLRLCAERGIAPKFSNEKADFTGEENYWKLLIDRKMVDNVTGEIIEQQTIKPVFDEGEVLRILNDELERYPKVKADQEYAIRTVIERFLSGKMDSRLDADTIASIMQKPVDNVTVTNIVSTANQYDELLSQGTSEVADDGIKRSRRDYSYEALVSKPDMAVTTISGEIPGNRADVVAIAKRNAAKVGKANKDGSVSVHVKDIDTDVVLTTHGLRHGLRRKQQMTHANGLVTLMAGEIIQNSIRVNELIPADNDVASTYILMGIAQGTNGDIYIVRSVVNKYDNELVSMDALYAVNAKKELAALNAPRLTAKPLSVTSSVISISDLLDYVNRYFPDTLPEDVLKHYGYTERPVGELGTNAMYSKRKVSPITDDDYRKLESHFGVTGNHEFAGYLLPNGKMLDFSGKHWGNPYPTGREVDHRDVWDVWENSDRDGTDEMVNMIGNGSIRLMPESGGINLAVAPNKAQQSALVSYIRHFKGEVMVDVDEVGGDTVHSFIYNRGTAPMTVIRDIMAYFEDGTIPQQQPEYRQFLYQRREGVSTRSLLANALESTAQNDMEKRRLKEYKAKIDLIVSEEQQLQALRERIKELSFAKGHRDTAEIRRLQDEATRVASRIHTYDRQLLTLEATAPLKSVLEREKALTKKRAEKKGKEALAAYREKATATQREIISRYQESRKKGIESRHRTELRHKIKDVVAELNNLLLHGTRDKHIMIGLQKATAEALAAVNMDTVNAEERLAEIQRKINASNNPDEIASLQQTYDRIEQQGENMARRLSALKDAYEDIKDSSDPLVAGAYHPEIEERIKNLRKEIGDTPLREMTIEQLEQVYDTYRMVLHTIRTANKAFKAKKQTDIATLANMVMEEVHRAGGAKPYSIKGADWVKKFYWNALKPVYAFKAIGSDTMSEMFDNVRAGEDTWAVDVSEARDFFKAVSKKYKYDSWDFEKQYQFKSKTGKAFSLSIEQIMSLYAYSKREQAGDHLEKGGFVFDEAIEITEKKHGIPVTYRVNTATSHNLSRDILGEIIGTMSAEQRAFVDEMQAYLSDTMGAKGNEVSLEMFGVKLFKEKFYFPLKSAKQFMYEQSEVAGEVKLKHSGFSKETVAHASNPIILSNFMDVWANHVNDMSMYHAFVLPLEDFNRVFNYKTPTTESLDTESVKMYIQNAYGHQAIQYIKQLLTDLNGGARTDPTADIITKMTGLFKKAAVFASASVVVQQPSAIARAAALIDTKYFATKLSLAQHKAEWAEVKKYAPVAIIKEMGYFDTHMGRSTTDFIKAKDYDGVAEKLQAVVTDSGYRDEVLSKAPAVADELAWCYIWNAVKKEIAATTDLEVGSEEFLKKCGERFTEVVVKTQVYDSVLSRSAMMRSKDTGMKMATAFMAEPTTSINMLADAVIQGKRGRKGAGKTVGAVAASLLLNSILVSFVYAGRDDDEDKTYAEKYVGTLTAELKDSINPLTMIPFVKDIISIAQGYDVERSDMAIVSDLFTAFEKLSNDNLSTYRKIEDFGGAIASIFGLPVKNIMREFRAVYNTVNSFINGQKTTGEGLLQAVKEGLTGEADSNADQLYEAIISGDKAQEQRIRSRYKDTKSAETAIRTALREHDPRIREAAEARSSGDIEAYSKIAREIISEGNFTQDMVVSAINSEINAINKESDGTEADTSETDEAGVESIYKANDINAALEEGDTQTAKVVIEDLVDTKVANGKTEKEAKSSIKSSVTSYWKPLYLAAYNSKDTAEMTRIRKLLATTGLYVNEYGASTVVETVQNWIKSQK